MPRSGVLNQTCPVCGSASAAPFLHIPSQPVHCNLLWDERDAALGAPRGDIDLSYCKFCTHIYNVSFDDSATGYGAAYDNSLHHSSVFQDYAKHIIEDLVHGEGIVDKDIVEVGAGQGDFLRMLCEAGGNRGVGFDPSHVSGAEGVLDSPVTMVSAFYGPEFADQPADLIVSRHMLEHIERSGDFLKLLRATVAARDTLVFCEVPDAMWSLRGGGIWDLIYEHCGYFTDVSLREAFRRAGFAVTGTDSVFGQQFLTVKARAHQGRMQSPAEIDRESNDIAGIVSSFREEYLQRVEEWRNTLGRLAEEGATVVVWGGGSKCVNFLNTADVECSIEVVVDLNPRKQGRYVPGTGQRIIPPEDLPKHDPDVVIVMNPNYHSEIQDSLDAMGIACKTLQA